MTSPASNGGHYDHAGKRKAYEFETSLGKVLTIARKAGGKGAR
jgi:hypothetical protein